jgi:hypothetical protein
VQKIKKNSFYPAAKTEALSPLPEKKQAPEQPGLAAQ